MPVTRVPQFPESVTRRTAEDARNDLEVYSSTEVDNLISAIDLSPYATDAELASVSGSVSILSSNVNAISGDVVALDTFTQEVSGNLTIDVVNLDISLTDLIFNHIVPGAGTPSVTGSINAWGKIENISAGPYYIPLYK